MSKTLRENMLVLAESAGGSQKTRRDRVSMVNRFVDILRRMNINITSVEHIKAQHIIKFMEQRREEDLDLRTYCNEMACLRVILRKSGRKQLVDNPSLSNKSLGIAGGSRRGKKEPCPENKFQEFFTEALKRDIGFVVCMMLGLYLGLRRDEAIQSIKSIKTWYRRLLSGKDTITVVFGTKGGRQRNVRIFNKSMALTILKLALRVMKARDGVLIQKMNLKQARDYFSNIARKVGFKDLYAFHSLRYKFAVSNTNSYLVCGHTLSEALALTSMDLGHGDGRGRYVKMVYGRSMIIEKRKSSDLKSIEDLFED